jgi:glucose-1-phosphatase
MHLLYSRISHPAILNPGPVPETGITMHKPAKGFPMEDPIRNIIFDFGNVICNIDISITENRFVEMGFKVGDPDYPPSASKRLFEELEAGKLTPVQFRDSLRPFFAKPVSDQQIDDAWNALLLDIPQPRIDMLEKIRNNYRIFMLTNTNQIHYLQYVQTFRKQTGYGDFDGLFEKAYYSYRIGLQKPDPEIFRYVLSDSSLLPSETLFIDDTLMHVESARSLGITCRSARGSRSWTFLGYKI